MKQYTIFIVSEGSSDVFKFVKINAETCEFEGAFLVLTVGGNIVAHFLNSKVAGFAKTDNIS